MKKPLINNRRLNDKWSAQTNELMIKKLQGVKANINSKCPESFFFFKTQLKKTNSKVTKMEKYELEKSNETLLHKLLESNIERRSKLNKNRTPFTLKKNYLTGRKKYDIIRIAQENQLMLKRLNERTSFYNINQWEKDYQMNQYYKRSHCSFPSIDFKRSNSGVLNQTIKTATSPRTGLSSERKKYNNSYSNFEGYEDYDCNDKSNNYIQINEDSQKDHQKILFKTQVYLGTLGSCRIEFAVQMESFTLKIESIYEKERVYGIIFDSRKSVENIQKYYRRYEDMINQLEYDEKNDLVKFNNLIKKDLICRCIKIPSKVDIINTEKIGGDDSKVINQDIKQREALPNDKNKEKVFEAKEQESIPMDINNHQDNKDQIIENNQKNAKEEETLKDINIQDNKAKDVEYNNQNDIKDYNEEKLIKEKDNSLHPIEELTQTENKMKDNDNIRSNKEEAIEVPSFENNIQPQEEKQIKMDKPEDNGIEEEMNVNN